MENRTTIYEWIQKFQKGGFDGEDKEAQTRAGWYDWFCKKESLAGKTKVLGKKLIQIVFSEKFNINKTYVFFKNNCPMNGSLYDDFRICDIESGNVLYTVTPKGGYEIRKGNAEVWEKKIILAHL